MLELKSWVGTRFVDRAAPAIKGVRCDCVSFVERVLVNLKAIDPIKWPHYVTRNGGEPMKDLLLTTLDQIPKLTRVISGPEAIGDLLVYSSGKAMHHLAIFAGDNTIWHALSDAGGVCTGNIKDPVLADRLIAVYRAKP